MINLRQLVEAKNQQGIGYARQGNIEKAEKIFKEALTLTKNPESYCLLGITAQKRNDIDGAIKFYYEALKLDHKYPAVHNNLGGIFLGKRLYQKAIAHFRITVSVDPSNSYAYCNLGNAYQVLSKHKLAVKYWEKSIDVNPKALDGYFNLGIYYSKINNVSKSNEYLKKVVKISPILDIAYRQLGLNYFKINRFAEAIANLELFLTTSAADELIYSILGNCYLNIGRYRESLANFKMALKLNPAFSQAQNDLGNYYFKTFQLDKALVCYKNALKTSTTGEDTYNNLAAVYLAEGRLKQASDSFKKSIRLNPKSANAFYGLGLINDKLGKPKLGAESFAKAVRFDPMLSMAKALQVFMLMQICDWPKYRNEAEKLDKLTTKEIKEGVKPGESPFINVLRKDDLEQNYQIAKLTCQNIDHEFGHAIEPFSYPKHNKKKKITIGYLSYDFYTHATSQLILGLFRHHDRSKFKIYTYSYGPDDKSMYRKTVEKYSDKFTDIRNTGHIEAAKLINKDGVDILVELKGHTQYSRLEIPAMRPSPIQVSYLGFPGTTGADFIDYLITDKIVTPRSFTKYYSEKFAYLPDCYQINDNRKPISKKIYQKKDFGLPENAFIFSSFNTPTKISPATFAVWVKILKKTPSSILWLLDCCPETKINLKKELARSGIDPKRIYFAPKLSNPEHLARIKLVDVSLDTFIYNGHTTTSDCLWAGVPVITLQGKHFASRVASSILTATKLTELITKTPKQYEDLAVKLAKDKGLLEKVKTKLNKNRLTTPLFDTEKFVKDLEKLYQLMWKNYLRGEKPSVIEL